MDRRTGVIAAFAAVALSLTMATPALATTEDADSVDRGWYESDGMHISGSMNYCAGPGCPTDNPDNEVRDFFVFDLTPWAADAATYGVSEAWVNLPNPLGTGSPAPYRLHHVGTPIVDLVAEHAFDSASGMAVYDDLGDGTVYGSVTPPSVNDLEVVVPLNAEGRLALTEMLGSQVAMGGRLMSTDEADSLFRSSGGVLASDIEIEFYLGTKTTTTIKAKGRVRAGTRVKVSGAVTSTDPQCQDQSDLLVGIGKKTQHKTTKPDGTYAFKVKITKKTRVRVLNSGDTIGPDCGPSQAGKVIKAV